MPRGGHGEQSGEQRRPLPRLRRYGPAARWYDLLSLERPVYRAPRILGISKLDLQPGERVLDVACGTGYNLPFLIRAVGPTGEVIGIDSSEAMLAGASRRISDNGWTNVTIRYGTAAELTRVNASSFPFDAVVITYALSVMDSWREVFEQSVAQLKPGGRLLVVDLAPPTGRWRPLAPLARLACLAGGVHLSRRPWRLVARDLRQAGHEVARGGHVHIAWGQKG